MTAWQYVYIDVVETAQIFGLDIRQITLLRTDEVQARCPYCQDYKYRMYLSRDPANPTWFCHNCSTSGNAVTLYADWNPSGRRLTTKQAFYELLNNPQIHSVTSPYEFQQWPEPTIKPLKERSKIYFSLLEMLTLEHRHFSNLLARGLSPEVIHGNFYRSFPTDERMRQHITDKLASKFDLSNMPGFYTKDFKWKMAGTRSGILTPVCDKDNLIQGLQIRLDEPPPKIITLKDGTKKVKKGERFRWLSTGASYYENGTGIKSFIHVVGDIHSDVLHLTEGVIKPDVASYLSGGELFVGLTGVQNLRYLPRVLDALHPRKIVECIDMDLRTNLNVQKAQSKIQAICMPRCQEYEQFYWPTDKKGIDDYLLFEKLKAQQTA